MSMLADIGAHRRHGALPDRRPRRPAHAARHRRRAGVARAARASSRCPASCGPKPSTRSSAEVEAKLERRAPRGRVGHALPRLARRDLPRGPSAPHAWCCRAHGCWRTTSSRSTCPARVLYEWDGLTKFLGAVLDRRPALPDGRPARRAEPHGHARRARAGLALRQHRLRRVTRLQASEHGGEFECARDIRSADRRVLRRRGRACSAAPATRSRRGVSDDPGHAMVFMGRCSIHRVAPVERRPAARRRAVRLRHPARHHELRPAEARPLRAHRAAHRRR